MINTNETTSILNAILEWLSDHEQAKQDVINFIKTNYPKLEISLIDYER